MVQVVLIPSRTKTMGRNYLIPLVLLVTLLAYGVTIRSNDDYLQIEFQEINVSHNVSQARLNLASMNIAQLVPSKRAPVDWSQQDQETAVLSELLRRDPDVICLQESPSAEWAEQVFSEQYNVIGSTRSHAGFVSLLIQKNLHTQEITKLSHLPMVAATVNLLQDVVIASVHLEPFQQGSFERLDQIETLRREVTTYGPLIMLGDTNMRDEEDDAVEKLGFMDAWKQAGSNATTRYSWDTMLEEDGTQNLYYGASTRAYQRRYDRIYYSAEKWINIRNFDLIANRPASQSTQHFLSDHFGIAATMEFYKG